MSAMLFAALDAERSLRVKAEAALAAAVKERDAWRDHDDAVRDDFPMLAASYLEDARRLRAEAEGR